MINIFTDTKSNKISIQIQLQTQMYIQIQMHMQILIRIPDRAHRPPTSPPINVQCDQI